MVWLALAALAGCMSSPSGDPSNPDPSSTNAPTTSVEPPPTVLYDDRIAALQLELGPCVEEEVSWFAEMESAQAQLPPGYSASPAPTFAATSVGWRLLSCPAATWHGQSLELELAWSQVVLDATEEPGRDRTDWYAFEMFVDSPSGEFLDWLMSVGFFALKANITMTPTSTEIVSPEAVYRVDLGPETVPIDESRPARVHRLGPVWFDDRVEATSRPGGTGQVETMGGVLDGLALAEPAGSAPIVQRRDLEGSLSFSGLPPPA